MEQEPVYVPSHKLTIACEEALGRIYDCRQQSREQYVLERTRSYNEAVAARNKRWARIKRWIGRPPEMYVTPQGMENMLLVEVRSMDPEQAQEHPMIAVQREYGRLEHEAKDAMVMCKLADTVPISADFARGLSHLGVDPAFMHRAPFGFCPNKR